MRSAGNIGVGQRFQVLHIHVLLIVPLGTGDMAESGADQHRRRVSVREAACHTGAPTDFPVQPFNDVVGADPSPMLRLEPGISQRFFI